MIALVVTIIVLLILAGVSINLVLGDNGIITKAKEAKENTELAKVEEEVQLNEAVEYLENVAKKTKKSIRLGGHSKGGNLAIYAAAFSKDDTRKRIIDIYQNHVKLGIFFEDYPDLYYRSECSIAIT